MTDRQQKFADEYIIDCNASRAYKAAYPGVKKDSVAGAAGARLLKNVRIKAYIEEKLAEISSQKTAKATEVMEYLTSVMRGEHTEEIPILCGDGCQELTEKAVGAKERLKAAELIGKRYGMFTDKVDVDGAVPVVITGVTRLKIDVLGAKYDVHYRTPNQDAFLHDCDGYCDKTTREIVVKAGDNSSGLGDNDRYLRKVLRHEIIHAFLFESGIAENYRRPEWGHDETMIDWMAYQYPKITKALAETGCLED